MADDLRERVRRGDFVALADPALPLHLLAEPNADWWLDGLERCARQALRAVACALMHRRRDLAMEICHWSFLYVYAEETYTITRTIEESPSEEVAAQQVSEAVNSVFYRSEGGPSGCWLSVELARRLLTLFPSTPPEIDAALAVLERYAG